MSSMGSTGDAYDNSMAESFFASLEREVIYRRRFKSRAEPAWRSLPGCKAGTTPIGTIPHSATCDLSTTRGRCYQEPLGSQALNRPRKRGKPTTMAYGGREAVCCAPRFGEQRKAESHSIMPKQTEQVLIRLEQQSPRTTYIAIK